MEGYGRGGRGAALLQALKEKNSQAQQTAANQREDGRSFGRGVFSSSMSHGPLPPDQKGPTTSSVSSPLSKPAGRGLAAMQALLEASRPKESSQSSDRRPSHITGLGRSRGLALAAATATKSIPPIGIGKTEATHSLTTETDSGRSTISPHSTSPDFHPAEESDSQNILRKQFQKLDIEPHHAQGKKDGKSVNLSANYIKIACKNEGVYQYHVSFSPEVDSKSMRYKMVYEHVDVTGKTRAFDGSILFLPIKLENTETKLTSTRLTDGVVVSITIKLVKVLKPESCTTLYNIIFRRIMSILQMKQVGRYYYNPNTSTAIPQHKLEIWPGYITAIQEYDGGLMLMADASHKVLRKETVLDVMFSLHKKDPVKFKDESMKTIIGSVVLTWYNNKTYRIDDISWNMTPKDTFQSSTGESTTFVDYYKKQYGLEIRDINQPLLLHKGKKKLTPEGDVNKNELICLIPEFCFMTGLTDDMKSDFRVMKDIAAHTRVTPMQRQLTLKKFIDSIKSTPDAQKQLENWGLYIEQNTINLPGRSYQPEKIFMQGKEFLASHEADWGRDLTRAAVITPVALKNWVVLTCRQDIGKSKDFISMMMKVTGPMGIEVSNPQTIETRDNRTETLIRLLRETINSRLQLVVVIFPASRDDKYSAVKKLCCVECPIPSQVIIARTISQQQKLRSVTQKIALQINCKLGGDLWAVDIPMRNLMVVGIDVYHDSPKNKRSIGAFVASTNHTFTRWFSRVCFQQPNQELIDGLKVCLISALTKYHELNHSLPRHIVVFRDGVSDSQLSVVSGHEVEQLSKCFSHFGDNYSPVLTVIIVQKRVNTRIFVNQRNIMENAPPGTIVDHTITRKQKYDFFLVSQHVRQGTVTPTHYIVVHDTSEMQVNHIQRLTYKMTHLYYNWPGTIRVPAPCQYAHKLAYLVGQSIHKEPAQKLADRLYFL